MAVISGILNLFLRLRLIYFLLARHTLLILLSESMGPGVHHQHNLWALFWQNYLDRFDICKGHLLFFLID